MICPSPEGSRSNAQGPRLPLLGNISLAHLRPICVFFSNDAPPAGPVSVSRRAAYTSDSPDPLYNLVCRPAREHRDPRSVPADYWGRGRISWQAERPLLPSLLQVPATAAARRPFAPICRDDMPELVVADDDLYIAAQYRAVWHSSMMYFSPRTMMMLATLIN